jgi:hypothetical protein
MYELAMSAFILHLSELRWIVLPWVYVISRTKYYAVEAALSGSLNGTPSHLVPILHGRANIALDKQ